MNILYLDDYINYYSKKINNIIKIKPYKKTLINGKIENKKKFINIFDKLLTDYNLKNNLFKESITIIINNNYTEEDKLLLKDLFLELNYKNIIFKSETDYLNIKKNILYINYNYSYFYFLFINNIGNVEVNIYQNNYLNRLVIIMLVKKINPKYIFLYGKNIIDIKDLLNKNKIDYYYYLDSDNLIINLMLNQILM